MLHGIWSFVRVERHKKLALELDNPVSIIMTCTLRVFLIAYFIGVCAQAFKNNILCLCNSKMFVNCHEPILNMKTIPSIQSF